MIERMTLCSATVGEPGKKEPPLGALSVAAALESLGVAVDFRDYQLAPSASWCSGEPLARFLEGSTPVVGVSCFADMLPAVLDATRRLCRRRPETTVILGGPGPSAAGRRILQRFPWVDGVVSGEGEETIAQWVAWARRPRSESLPIASMTLRHRGRVIVGPPRPRLADLDALPRPAYHLLDWSAYERANVITMRGCPYRCGFCDVAALWGHRSVYRGLDRVLEEMLMLRDVHGKRGIGIVDDTFVQNPSRVREFCRLLLRHGSGIEWGCFARVNLMTRELAEEMAEAGCRAVFYGVDSGSPKVLERIQKGMHAEDVLPVLRFSARLFGRTEVSFIWGYPFESLDDFRQTLDLAGEASRFAPRANVQLHMLSPLPHSPLWRSFRGSLRRPSSDDRQWLLLPPLLLDPGAEPLRRMVLAVPDVFPGFFCFPTPARKAKLRLLQRAISALERTVGNTLLDPAVDRLLDRDEPATERRLLRAETHPSDRIGVGLALGLLRRARRQRAADRAGTSPIPTAAQIGRAHV